MDDETPDYEGSRQFTVRIKHGGQFWSGRDGVGRRYVGRESVWIDFVEEERIGLQEIVCWGWDLGYRVPPIQFWGKDPDREDGFIVLDTERAVARAYRGLEHDRVFTIYLVSGPERKEFSVEELGVYEYDIDWRIYLGWVIDDKKDYVSSDSEEVAEEVAEEEVAEQEGPINGGAESMEVSDGPDLGNWADLGNGPEEHEERDEDESSSSYSDGQFWEDEAHLDEADDVVTEDVGDVDRHDDEEERQGEEGQSSRQPQSEGRQAQHGQVYISEDDEEGLRDQEDTDSDGEDRGRFRVNCRRRFDNWRVFNEEIDGSTVCPELEIGMEFPNDKAFKLAVKKVGIKQKKEIRFDYVDKYKVSAVCKYGMKKWVEKLKLEKACPFRIYASTTNKANPSIYLKTLKLEHTCGNFSKKTYHMSASFIARNYCSFFINDPSWSRAGMVNTIGADYDMLIDYQVAYNARRKARKLIEGSEAYQYNLLESYAGELIKRNLGSSVWIQSEEVSGVQRFKRIYICLEPLARGWKFGCRPIIGLDGCHLKGNIKGILLTAVGIDGNNGMFPIAWAVVEQENKSSWEWFLEYLVFDLDLIDSRNYCFISDKQKGLEQVMKDMFPEAAQRHCVRHLHNNFKNDGHGGLELKNKLWAIARSYTHNKYVAGMEDLKKASVSAWQWCMDRPAVNWCRAFFDKKFNCDILLNNHSESFNKSILEARRKPIISLLEDIRCATMARMTNRRASISQWKCAVGPRIEKQLKKAATHSNDYRVVQASPVLFELHGRGAEVQSGVMTAHYVNLERRTCTCGKWDISGIRCSHVIAAIFAKGSSPDLWVDDYYSKEAYMRAYQPVLNPITGVSEWEKRERPLGVPTYRRMAGRPSNKARRKEADESRAVPPPGLLHLPRRYYARGTCSVCKRFGHNKRRCHLFPSVENVQEEHVPGHSQPPVMSQDDVQPVREGEEEEEVEAGG